MRFFGRIEISVNYTVSINHKICLDMLNDSFNLVLIIESRIDFLLCIRNSNLMDKFNKFLHLLRSTPLLSRNNQG